MMDPDSAFLCRANAQQPKLFVGMILILIFAEALALYGLIGVPLLFQQMLCFFACMSRPLSVLAYRCCCLCLRAHISRGMADSFSSLTQLASFWPPRQEQPLRALRQPWQARHSRTRLGSAPSSTGSEKLLAAVLRSAEQAQLSVCLDGVLVEACTNLGAYHCFMSMT